MKRNQQLDEDIAELCDRIVAEREMNGEDTEAPVYITDEQLREFRREKYGETDGSDEKPPKNTLFLILFIISVIVFVSAFVCDNDDLIGFGLGGMVLSPAFARTANSRFGGARPYTITKKSV